MRVLRILFVVVFCFFVKNAESARFRPIFYYFSNGASLSFSEGQLNYTPPSGPTTLQKKTQTIGEDNIYLAPEGVSQTSKNPNHVILTQNQDTPLLLQTKPAQAVPFIWTDINGVKKMAIATQDGQFHTLDDALKEVPHLKNTQFSGLAFRVIGINEFDYSVIATVATSQNNLVLNEAFPWIVTSQGHNVLIPETVPLNFSYRLDTNTSILIQTKNAQDALLNVDIEDPNAHSIEDKSDYADWKQKVDYQPLFAFIDRGDREWKSESHSKLRTVPASDPSNNKTQNNPKPKAPAVPVKKVIQNIGPIPNIMVEGRGIPANKLLAEFARKYQVSDLPDYGYQSNDFRALAVPLFSETGGSIVVTGESGEGKSTFVESFARSILNGEFIDKGINPADTEIFYFSASELSSGTKYVGTMETKLEAAVKYAEWASKNGKKVFFVIDEIHSLIGQGTKN